LAAALLLLLAVPLSSAYGQTKPAFVAVGTATTLSTIGSYGAGHVAANSLGDVFYSDQKAATGYYVPHGTTSPVALITGLSGGRNTYVDSSNNVYFPSNYSGYVVMIPYVKGAYTTGTALASVTTNCTSTSTAPCRAFTATSMGSSNSVIGGYYQPTDLGIDGSGNVYVLEASDSTGVSGYKVIKLVPASTSGTLTYTASLLVNFGATNLSALSAEVAVDSTGDVYFTNKTNTDSTYATCTGLYQVPAGSSTASAFGSCKTPAGVSVDRYGNVFVPDSSSYAYHEFPAVNGVANTSAEFTPFYGYSGYGIGFDGRGHYFYVGYSGGNVMYRNSIYGYDFGSGPIGTSLGTQTFTLTYSGSYTPAAIKISSLSPSAFTYTAGSCATGAVSQGSNCTVTVGYTPSAVGLQRGELVLLDSSGTQIGALPVSGTGTGALQTIDPGVQTSLGSGWKSPKGIDVDSSGAIYVADSGANAVYRYASVSDVSPNSIGSNLSAPTDVKLDAAGNAYIADSGNGRIVVVPIVNGSLSSSAQSVLYSDISSNTGLALDRNANLYVADSGNARVLEIAAAGGIPNPGYIRTIGSGFTYPVAVSTDSSGNVYVVDQEGSSTNDVTEVVSAGGALNTIGTGYSNPSGLAVDASGSVYVADTSNDRLIKVPSENGAINANDQTSVGGTVAAPHGVAVDGSGNLYVTDSTNGVVAQIARTQGVLNLGSANLNTTTSQQAAEVTNAGNSALSLGTPAYTASGDTSYFTVATSSSSACTAGLALSSGSACTVAATFTPTVMGAFSDVLTFSSNATDSSSSTLTIEGKGTYIAPTSLALTQTSPSGTPSFGQSLTIAANLTYTANGSAVPSGTVIFYVDNAQYKQAVTITNNTAAITISGLTAGSHTFGASYSGDTNYASSSASTLSLTIARISSSVSITGLQGVSSNPTSAVPGATLVYTATVVPTGTVAPTGTVSFYAGTTQFGSAAVVASGSAYTAQLSTTNTPEGNDSITAVYNGDVNYLPSTSDAVTVEITAAAYTLTPASGTLSVKAGQTGSINFTITSQSGYAGTLGFSCSGLPAFSQCSFSPVNFSLVSGVPQTVTMQIITTQSKTDTPPTVGMLQRWGAHSRGAAPLAFALLCPLGLLGLRRYRKSFRRALGLLLFAALLAGSVQCVTGCGGNLNVNSPKGTYAVVVTAYGTNSTTSATTMQTATISLTVQ